MFIQFFIEQVLLLQWALTASFRKITSCLKIRAESYSWPYVCWCNYVTICQTKELLPLGSYSPTANPNTYPSPFSWFLHFSPALVCFYTLCLTAAYLTEEGSTEKIAMDPTRNDGKHLLTLLTTNLHGSACNISSPPATGNLRWLQIYHKKKPMCISFLHLTEILIFKYKIGSDSSFNSKPSHFIYWFIFTCFNVNS